MFAKGVFAVLAVSLVVSPVSAEWMTVRYGTEELERVTELRGTIQNTARPMGRGALVSATFDGTVTAGRQGVDTSIISLWFPTTFQQSLHLATPTEGILVAFGQTDTDVLSFGIPFAGGEPVNVLFDTEVTSEFMWSMFGINVTPGDRIAWTSVYEGGVLQTTGTMISPAVAATIRYVLELGSRGVLAAQIIAVFGTPETEIFTITLEAF